MSAQMTRQHFAMFSEQLAFMERVQRRIADDVPGDSYARENLAAIARVRRLAEVTEEALRQHAPAAPQECAA